MSESVAVPLLELQGITKKFPGVVALDDVSLSLFAGEIHMLVGENGAGKSTLMKILCGACSCEAGQVLAEGHPVRMRNAADARALGIAVIFQEFSLVPHLDVAQNIFLGREPLQWWGGIDQARMHARACELLLRLNIDIDTHLEVAELGVAQQQMVEIAKALSQNARVLVLDEPTATLSEHEAERLFAVINELRRAGVAMVYISHRMNEVFSLGDRISVLRDGRLVTSMMANDATADDLVTLMVGREVDLTYQREKRSTAGEPLLEVSNISSVRGVKDVTLNICAGEIVGLSGLVGSGRTEVARAIFGADRLTAGEIRYRGRTLRGSPGDSRRQGIGLLPESRKEQGIALMRTVCENLVLAALSRLFPSGSYRPARAEAGAQATIDQLRIATPGTRTPVRSLSGGNQQKVVIGKWLLAEARLLIFDEPTRGIDVGAKEEIFRLIDQLVERGCAVLMISSEPGEIVRICDRAYVMKDRRIAGEVAAAELSEAALLRLAMHHE